VGTEPVIAVARIPRAGDAIRAIGVGFAIRARRRIALYIGRLFADPRFARVARRVAAGGGIGVIIFRIAAINAIALERIGAEVI